MEIYREGIKQLLDAIDKFDYEKEKEKQTIARQEKKKRMQELKEKAEMLGKGEMTIGEYVMTENVSIEKLITLAKKEHMSSAIIINLSKLIKKYKAYKKPFDKDDYIKSTLIKINGEFVRPTEKDVDLCLKYMQENNILISNYTAEVIILKYMRGQIDITKKTEKINNFEDEER